MSTMKKLCKKFSRLNPGYTAIFDDLFSVPGYYRVYIASSNGGVGAPYLFTSCKEFDEWAKGVVMD